MGLADPIRSAEAPTIGRLRESWRQVISMKRSAQRFRTRLAGAQMVVEGEMEVDPQFGDVAAVMAVTIRILDWAIRDLDRLKLPDELFEVVPQRPVVRIAAETGARQSATR
jgi:hypothetical protein